MFVLDIILRGSSILMYLFRDLFWRMNAHQANSQRPKVKISSTRGRLESLFLRALWALLYLQILGLKILPFHHQTILQLIGFLLVIISMFVLISARRQLGLNWAPASEYQVKQKQELVTTGIYKYIRHPIYLGLLLSFVGGELVAESYLVIFFFILLPIGSYIQVKREEKTLIKHFGKRYQVYMSKTKRLIPYLF